MKQKTVFGAVAVIVAWMAVLLGRGADGRDDGKPAARKTSGLDKRVPWTTSKVRGSPDPPTISWRENHPRRCRLASPTVVSIQSRTTVRPPLPDSAAA